MATWLDDNVNIAGKETVRDWKDFSAKLNVSNNDNWESAYDRFLYTRIEERYFKYLDLMVADKTFKGKGFTIVTVLCSLVEFLESLYQGKNFKLDFKNELDRYGRESAKEMFLAFLQTKQPFAGVFVSKDDAKNFYAEVRCGLLHEAMTKGEWVIKSKGDFIDLKNKRVGYEDLYAQIKNYLEWYKGKLLQEQNVREAFLSKLNYLCHKDI
jgi:hypothetical protein